MVLLEVTEVIPPRPSTLSTRTTKSLLGLVPLRLDPGIIILSPGVYPMPGLVNVAVPLIGPE